MREPLMISSPKELYALEVTKALFPTFYETECRGEEDKNSIDGYIPPYSIQVKCDLRMSDTWNLLLQFSYLNDSRTRWNEIKFNEDIRIHICEAFLLWVPMPHLLQVSKKHFISKTQRDSKSKLIPISSLAPNYKLLKHSIPFHSND